MKVAGKNVVAYIKVGDNWELYACGTSITLTLNTDMIETSVSGQGKFATYKPTKNSFTATLEGVTSLEETGKLSLPDLRARQIAQDELLIKYQRTDNAGNIYIEQGSGFITSSSDTGSVDDMNTFTIDIQGTGVLIQSSEDSGTTSFTYYFGSTDINTVIVPGLGSVFPTEASFVSSVDDVFTASGEISGIANEGDNVSVADFEGDSNDRVKFLQVSNTELPFTKWSEENNPLQQNQPIDQTYNFLSGNVWFKSVRAGQTLYMTYTQTTFGGAIIFSR